ncbi:hypothetical protein ACWN6Y_04665 [Vagococcus teuberi]|nr:hypothetical protein [Vagococcus teuberi]
MLVIDDLILPIKTPFFLCLKQKITLIEFTLPTRFSVQSKKVGFSTKDKFEKVIATFGLSDYHEYFSFVLIWLLFMTRLRFGEA